jgi:AraC family transcriptional regulator
MDINKVFNNVINYIEENMCNEINYDEAAKIMGVSVFHFQRLFSFLTGTPIAEYIRCRRMTLAGFDIQKSNEKIIDIALKYGYESHSSFSRAFQLFHGVTPSAVRDKGKSIKIYPSIHLNITLKGNDIINFRIEKTDPYQLFGKDDIIVPMEHKYALEFIKNYGNMVVENGSHATVNMAAGYPVDDQHLFHLLHGIYFKDKEDRTHFMYGWEKPEHEIEDGFTVVDVPKTTWAVFNYFGEHMEGLPKIWTYIYTSWLYSSGYNIDDQIFIEKESWNDDAQKEICAEVWLAIKE